MKILTVIADLRKGGAQRAAQVFAEAYQELGHDSRLLALYELGPRYDELVDKISIYSIITNANLKLIRDWDPDIIHIHSHGPRLDDIQKLLLQKSEQTKVVETNVFSKPSPWAKLIDKSFQLSIWAQWIYNLQGGNLNDSSIVPYPVKCNTFQPATPNDVMLFKKDYNIPENAFVIGRIGQSANNKWSPMIIDVFEKLFHNIPELFLVMVNPPASIINRAKNSPHCKNIIYIPTIIGNNGLSVAYSTMDAMILIAERGESFGMVIPESILCGTPVVALSTPWADNSQCEVVGHLKGGYIANSSNGIIRAVLKIFEDKENVLAESGVKHIREHFDYLKVAQMAIDEAEQTKLIRNRLHKRCIQILNKSIDKPNFFTKLFLRANIDGFRRKTIYTSGYQKWTNFENS